MADIFNGTLETETSAFTTQFTGKTEDGSNALSITTASGEYHTGSKGAKIVFDGSNANAYAYKTLSDETEVYARFMLKVPTGYETGGTYESIIPFELLDGSTSLVSVRLQTRSPATAFRFYIYYYDGSSQQNLTYTGNLNNDQWYRLEFHWKAGSGSDGGLGFKLDGGTESSDFTNNLSGYAIDQVRVGSQELYADHEPVTDAELYWDECALDSSSWLGAPTAPGTSIDLTLAEFELSALNFDIQANIDTNIDMGLGEFTLAGLNFGIGGNVYYVRADGTASGKANATSDASASTSMSLSEHNWNNTYEPGDRIIISDAGGAYRYQLYPPSSGSSAARIQYKFKGDVEIRGSTLISGWTNYSGNVWQATLNEDPGIVWIDDNKGTEKAGIGSLASEFDWYWASNVLYLYSPSGDPDTVYTDPGVEYPTLSECVYIKESYLTFGLYDSSSSWTIRYPEKECIQIRTLGSEPLNDITIEDPVVRDNAYGLEQWHLIHIGSVNNFILRRAACYNSDRNSIDMNLYDGTRTSTPCSGYLIEQCLVYNAQHTGIDVHAQDNRRPYSDVTVRHNYLDGYGSIYCSNEYSDTSSVHDIKIYGNVVVNGGQWGIWLDQYGDGEYFEDCVIYNNTVVNCGVSDVGGGIRVAAVGCQIKNNICYNNNINQTFQPEIWVVDGGGTANVVDYNLVYHDSHTDLYREDGTDYTHSEYQTFGQQTYGINDDPDFYNESSDQFWLKGGSPCIDQGASLASAYQNGLGYSSAWPSDVNLNDQTDYGTGWDIGAYIFTAALDATMTLGELELAALNFDVQADVDINVGMTLGEFELESLAWNVQADVDTNIDVGLGQFELAAHAMTLQTDVDSPVDMTLGQFELAGLKFDMTADLTIDLSMPGFELQGHVFDIESTPQFVNVPMGLAQFEIAGYQFDVFAGADNEVEFALAQFELTGYNFGLPTYLGMTVGQLELTGLNFGVAGEMAAPGQVDIFVRYTDAANWVRVVIYPDGNIALEKAVNGEWEEVDTGTQLSASDVPIIDIIVSGSSIQVNVDGTLDLSGLIPEFVTIDQGRVEHLLVSNDAEVRVYPMDGAGVLAIQGGKDTPAYGDPGVWWSDTDDSEWTLQGGWGVIFGVERGGAGLGEFGLDVDSAGQVSLPKFEIDDADVNVIDSGGSATEGAATVGTTEKWMLFQREDTGKFLWLRQMSSKTWEILDATDDNEAASTVLAGFAGNTFSGVLTYVALVDMSSHFTSDPYTGSETELVMPFTLS